LNYSHAFHAGNFADLVKHAVLLQLLAEARQDTAALAVLDTHAGRGLYDLTGPEARRSGEAEAGIGRLMVVRDAPGEFAPLVAAVKRLNPGGGLARYPGSPWLVAEALRPQDSYVGWELRHSEHAALAKALKGRRNVEVRQADGFAGVVELCPRRGRALVLIDPPFERGDDYARAVAVTAGLVTRNPAAQVVVWLPLKDLETFDAFLRDLEAATDAPVLVGEMRMRPLDDPMRMNGCALALVGVGARITGALSPICQWTAETLGKNGAARVYSV